MGRRTNGPSDYWEDPIWMIKTKYRCASPKKKKILSCGKKKYPNSWIVGPIPISTIMLWVRFWPVTNCIRYNFIWENLSVISRRGSRRGRTPLEKKGLAWLDWQSLYVKYVISTLCFFDSSLHCNEYSYLSLLSRSGSCKNRHRLHFTFCNHGCWVWSGSYKTTLFL
jgi:hypothetical protein